MGKEPGCHGSSRLKTIPHSLAHRTNWFILVLDAVGIRGVAAKSADFHVSVLLFLSPLHGQRAGGRLDKMHA